VAERLSRLTNQPPHVGDAHLRRSDQISKYVLVVATS
jgi:hypothetical protein